jgi:ParB-like chromosome segregation protein Spo0J
MNVNTRLKPARPASKQPGLEIIYRPVNGLKPDPANPRLHSNKQIRQIAKSIETFGFNVPILVDADLNVICGHGRVLACRELGMRPADLSRRTKVAFSSP